MSSSAWAWGRPENWQLCSRLVPHSEAVIARMGDTGPEREAMAWLMESAATYLHQCAAYSRTFLLADDDKIRDETILRQISR